MKKYLISLYSWENPRLYGADLDLKEGERVVIEGGIGNDVGKVVAAVEVKESPVANIVRKATEKDITTAENNLKKRDEILHVSKAEIKRLELDLKLIDARVNLDGSGMMVVFTAEGRVDFRELVKNLAKIFRRSVKMHQIGSRDEARKLGGCGVCGRELCCVVFSGNLPSITTEMAKVQQIAHRGSERISGLCGRLMCCLAYEADQYRKMLEGMPELHSVVRTKKNKGEVIEINAIKQEVKIKSEDGIISVKREDLI